MENFWSRLLWITAAFSIIFGIAQMQLSVQGGGVTMAGAALMVPPFSAWLGKRSGRLWWAPPIVGFLIATLIGPIVTFATAPGLEAFVARPV